MQYDLITPGAHLYLAYEDKKGDASFRPVEVLKVDSEDFFAHCALRNAARRFLFARVLAVYPAPVPAPVPTDTAKIVARMGRTLRTLAHTATLDAADSAMLADALDDARRAYRALAAA